MTVLYNHNFEGLATNAIPTGWVSAASTYKVFTFTATATGTIQGTQALFSNLQNANAVQTAIGTQTDQGIRFATKIALLTTGGFCTLGACLRVAGTATSDNMYRVFLETNNTGLRVTITKWNGATTVLASSTSYAFTPVPGDVVHFEASIVGTSIEARAWLNSDARPTTADNSVGAAFATAVATDSSFTSGYAGLYNVGSGGTYVGADNLVIADGATGLDYYYAPVVPAATIAWTESPDTIAIAATASVPGVSAAIAWTESADTIAVAGTAAAATGTITTPVLKNNTGTILANETGVVVNVYNASTGALVVRKTGQTSSAGGIVTVTDALIVAATSYAYEVVLTSNGRRLPLATAT